MVYVPAMLAPMSSSLIDAMHGTIHMACMSAPLCARMLAVFHFLMVLVMFVILYMGHFDLT